MEPKYRMSEKTAIIDKTSDFEGRTLFQIQRYDSEKMKAAEDAQKKVEDAQEALDEAIAAQVAANSIDIEELQAQLNNALAVQTAAQAAYDKGSSTNAEERALAAAKAEVDRIREEITTAQNAQAVTAREVEKANQVLVNATFELTNAIFIRDNTGNFGGYIETEDNLSQEGECWIADNAKVYGNARIYENAQIIGDAQVYGNAKVHGNAQVSGNARVYDEALVSGSDYGNKKFSSENLEIYNRKEFFHEGTVIPDRKLLTDRANISGDTHIFGNAEIFGETEVFDNAQISGIAQISGKTLVFENAQIYGDSVVHGESRVFGNAKVTAGGVGGLAMVYGNAIVVSPVTGIRQVSK